MKLSRSAAYAISALMQLDEASSAAPISSHRLAVNGALPERFLLQVLRSLVNHGLLQSTRGVVGGYNLARPLSEISLLQVIEVTDGPLTPVVPPVEAVSDSVRKRLSERLQAIATDTAKRLSAVSLADLAGERNIHSSSQATPHNHHS